MVPEQVPIVRITDEAISPEIVVKQAKTDSSGCVVTYVGLIRGQSCGQPVFSVEYRDPDGTAGAKLGEIVGEARKRWPINKMVMHHRIGKLKVGDINLVVAVACEHRREGFAACQYAIDQFKEKRPTKKIETYLDGTLIEGD